MALLPGRGIDAIVTERRIPAPVVPGDVCRAPSARRR